MTAISSTCIVPATYRLSHLSIFLRPFSTPLVDPTLDMFISALRSGHGAPPCGNRWTSPQMPSHLTCTVCSPYVLYGSSSRWQFIGFWAVYSLQEQQSGTCRCLKDWPPPQPEHSTIWVHEFMNSWEKACHDYAHKDLRVIVPTFHVRSSLRLAPRCGHKSPIQSRPQSSCGSTDNISRKR